MSLNELSAMLEKRESISTELRQAVSALLTVKLDHLPEKAQVSVAAAEFHKCGWVDDNILIKLARENPEADPFAEWQRLTDRQIPLKTRTPLISSMLQKDLPRTLDSFLIRPSTEEEPPFRTAIVQAKRFDTGETHRWFSIREGTLTTARHDDCVVAFTLHSLQTGEPDHAETWAEKAKDPKTRKALRQMITRLASRNATE